MELYNPTKLEAVLNLLNLTNYILYAIGQPKIRRLGHWFDPCLWL